MIHIVGIGGVGFWLAVGLSKVIEANQITCWDTDTLDGGTGATRLPWGPSTTKKTDLLTGYLRMVHAHLDAPTIMDRKFSGLLAVNEKDLVIDCTDMPLEARRRMWNCAKKRGATLLRVSYDGQGSVVLVSTGLPFHAPAEGGYGAVPSLALSFMAGGLGAEVVKRYLEHPVPYLNITLSVQEAMAQP